jgi:hypothetical protein
MRGIVVVPKFGFCDMLVGLHPFVDGREFIDESCSPTEVASLLSHVSRNSSRLVLWDELPIADFERDIVVGVYLPYRHFLTHKMLRSLGRAPTVGEVESVERSLRSYGIIKGFRVAPAVCGLLDTFRS